LCDNGKFGEYVAYELKDGSYYVTAIPLATHNSFASNNPALDKAISIVYMFNGIPNSDADVLNLQYHRYDPAHVGETDYATAKYNMSTFTATNHINAGDSTDVKFQKVFGNGSTPTATADLTAQKAALQAQKDAQPACSPTDCN